MSSCTQSSAGLRRHSGAMTEEMGLAVRPRTSSPGADMIAALQDLVTDGTLSAEQAARVVQRLTVSRTGPAAPATSSSRGGRLAEVAGYLGGALLLGGAALFLASGWGDLTGPARVLLLAAVTVALLLVGGLVARSARVPLRQLGHEPESRRRRLVSVLWTFAAASAAGSAGVAADSWPLVVAGGVAVAVATAGYVLVPGAVGQVGIWAGSMLLVAGTVAELGPDTAVTYSLALTALGALWAALAQAGVVHAREVGLACGAGLGLFAAQLPVLGGDQLWVGYLLTVVVAIAGFSGYLVARSWSVLSAGVLASTLVVPEALHHWARGSVPAAGFLLIAGLTLLGASAAGLRLRSEVG